MDILRETIRMLLESTSEEQVSNETPLSRRIDLRSSASTLADPAVDFMKRTFEKYGFDKKITFNIEYDTIDYIAEAEVGLNTYEESLEMPSGEYFDMIPDVDFVIQGNYDPKSSVLDVDAGYIHAGDDNLEDAGLIETAIQIPAPKIKAETFLGGAKRHLRATLVHEMQHSIQRLIYGMPLDAITNADLDTHMSDPNEIDARVEEIIAYMDDNIPEETFENFMVKLEGYISMYLERNAPDATMEEHAVYTNRMLDSHLQHYAEKLGIEIPTL